MSNNQSGFGAENNSTAEPPILQDTTYDFITMSNNQSGIGAKNNSTEVPPILQDTTYDTKVSSHVMISVTLSLGLLFSLVGVVVVMYIVYKRCRVRANFQLQDDTPYFENCEPLMPLIDHCKINTIDQHSTKKEDADCLRKDSHRYYTHQSGDQCTINTIDQHSIKEEDAGCLLMDSHRYYTHQSGVMEKGGLFIPESCEDISRLPQIPNIVDLRSWRKNVKFTTNDDANVHSTNSDCLRSSCLVGKERSEVGSLDFDDCELDNTVMEWRTSEWNEVESVQIEHDRLLNSPDKKQNDSGTTASGDLDVFQADPVNLCQPLFVNETSQIDKKYPNWEKVFIFLTERIGNDWRWFFVTLYGNSKVQIDMIEARISHTEENTKRKSGSHSTKYLILDQFRAWKESEGRQASVQTILSTLKALTRNDLLHDFEEFIRNTPFILKKCDPIESISHAHQSFNSSLEYCSLQSNSSLGYGLPPMNTILDNCLPHGSITHKRYEEICYATERLGQGDGEEGNDLNTEPKQLALLPMNDESSKEVVHLARYAESQTMVNEGKSESSSSQTFKSSRSNRETNMKKQNKTKFKRGRKKMPKHLYLSTDSLSIDSFFMMAKVLLDSEVKKFPKDIYEHLVRNTVVEIVNYTRNSEQTIISLKVEEFNKSLPHQTSKETIHSMYAGDTLLIVDDSNYELLLYVNKARKRIVKRLALEEKLDDFFFVSYEGKPLLEKNSSHEMAEGNDMSSDDTQDISVKETSSSSGEEN